MADAPGPVLAVCGLAAEARLAAGPGIRTVAGGGRRELLAIAIEREIASGARAIISIGIAGALAPGLRPGTLIVASSIVGNDASHPVDAAWSRSLKRRLPFAIEASLAGSDRVVDDPAAKAALSTLTGASAVDMESHVAARLAVEHGLPFVALRAVADPSDRALPPAALVAMRVAGGIDYAAVMGSLARSPGQLPLLLRIGFDAQRALRSLGRARRLLGDRLGYADLDELLVDVI